jgi:2-keto-4-pentenoate hydratase/2-oxohepta-3-ene-1,7-dioic acid hydratase in catechol pathway
MKLATFRVSTPVGYFDRLGIVQVPPTGDAGARLVDANAAYAAMTADQGWMTATDRADAFCPADLMRYAAVHGTSLEALNEALAWLAAKGGDPSRRGPRGETLGYALAEVQLRPPVARIPVLRDFAAFEDHLKVTFAKMGISIPEVWYERPLCFKGNGTSLYGHDQDVPWPSYARKLDYELELAAVIGRPARDVDVDKAAGHILGYTLLNDFSARDIQAGEMRNSTGPYKGKDFAWGLGPWIVTPDELGDPSAVKMKVLINGEVWAESTPGPMQWTFPEIVSYTSQSETLNIGDVFGSGTVNNGCGFEIDRWIKPGDTVELWAEGVGTLRHRVGTPEAEPRVNWRRAQAPETA